MRAGTKPPTSEERKKKKTLLALEPHSSLTTEKHTKENSAPFSHHENTRHLNVSGPSLYRDWCGTTFPLRCTIRRSRWGARGVSRGPPPAARSICVRGAAEFWPLCPVEEMDLLQAPLPAPTNYQSDAHTHANKHTLTPRRAWQQGSCWEWCAAEHCLLFIFIYLLIHFFGGILQKGTSCRAFNHLILACFSSLFSSWNTKGVQGLIKSDTRWF